MDPSATGVVHVSDLPSNVQVILREEFHCLLMDTVTSLFPYKTLQQEVFGIPRNRMAQYLCTDEQFFLHHLQQLLTVLGTDIDTISEQIIWIGHSNSQGISNPKLPFDLRSRAGVRLVAGICNEGWISEACCYSNSNQQQRESIQNDALQVFGGKREQFVIHESESDTFIRFPAVVKEIFLVLTAFQGKKSVNNPSIPQFVFTQKNFLLGWLEQTLADEGTIKYYPKKHRREVWWKRAFLESLDYYALHEDECRILDELGLKYSSYASWTYDSLDGKKVHAQIRIVGRESILFLCKHLRIPLQRKQELLSRMAFSYERYKERIHIWSCIGRIAQTSEYISAKELQQKMKYSCVSTARKWLRHYYQEGCLRRLEQGVYVLRQ